MSIIFKVQKGLSLIELLVSMLISGIILAGVVNVVLSSKVAFIGETENSFIQENARFVVETLTRDTRMAGFIGCAHLSSSLLGNIMNDDADGLLSWRPVRGYEDTEDTFPTSYQSNALSGSDSIILRFGDQSDSARITNHDASAAEFTFAPLAGRSWKSNEAMTIVDSSCRYASLFRASNPVSSASTGLSYSAELANNCTKVLKANATHFSCASTPCNDLSCGGNSGSEFGVGSQIMPYMANAYYIGNSNVIDGMPSLKRVRVGSSGTRTDEIAQGVESMNILYGVDSDFDASIDSEPVIDQFVKASDITNWDTVDILAIRYLLTFRSQSFFYDTDNKVELNGITHDDRYLRQIANITVRLRN